MANLRARIIASDSNRTKEASRLGSRQIVTHADTWKTFVTVNLLPDGSGRVTVARDSRVIHLYEIEAE